MAEKRQKKQAAKAFEISENRAEIPVLIKEVIGI